MHFGFIFSCQFQCMLLATIVNICLHQALIFVYLDEQNKSLCKEGWRVRMYSVACKVCLSAVILLNAVW